MANIPLQSISFPGLSDKYTTPVVDNTLTQAGAAADAKKVGDEVGAIKNDLSDGTMTVNNAENAEQLTSTVGIEDNAPYLFRTSGGSNDIGDREDVRKIVGGTIVNNQLAKSSWTTQTINGVTVTRNNDETWSISGTATGRAQTINIFDRFETITGHKYFLNISKTLTPFVLRENNGSLNQTATAKVLACTEGKNAYFTFDSGLDISGTTVNIQNVVITITDVTQAFGTAIADYVYSLETATAGAGVAWLKKHFPAQFDSDYQAYDAGSLQSVSGLTMHKMVGFNQFDGETYFPKKGFVKQADGSWYLASLTEMVNVLIWENKAGYSGNMSFTYEYKNINSSGSGGLRVKTIFTDGTVYIDYSPVTTAMTKRTITVNSNGRIVDRMVWDYGSSAQGTYLKDFCINFSWDGEKDGTYEPYKEYTYALDSSVTLRGNPKVDASGNLYYDGDEYLPDGTVNRRYGEVTFDGSSSDGWSHQANYGSSSRFDYASSTFGGKPYGEVVSNLFVKGLIGTPDTEAISLHGKSGHLIVQIQTSKLSADTVSGLMAYFAQHPLTVIYEKASTATETALPYQETQIVDDFGTEEFVLADTAFPVPVGHETYYKNNLRAKLEMSPDSPDGDGLYVVQQESGENTYVPLASTATIQDILTRLTALENA